MLKKYSEEEKIKYVQGFRKSHTPIFTYCDKMKINFKDLKHWLKEYTGTPKFGVIELKSEVPTTSKVASPTIKFESNGIKFVLNLKLLKNNDIFKIKGQKKLLKLNFKIPTIT